MSITYVLQSDTRDDELDQVPQGSVQQTANALAGPKSDLLGTQSKESRKGDDCQRRSDEDNRRVLMRKVQRPRDRNEDEQKAQGRVEKDGLERRVVARVADRTRGREERADALYLAHPNNAELLPARRCVFLVVFLEVRGGDAMSRCLLDIVDDGVECLVFLECMAVWDGFDSIVS